MIGDKKRTIFALLAAFLFPLFILTEWLLLFEAWNTNQTDLARADVSRLSGFSSLLSPDSYPLSFSEEEPILVDDYVVAGDSRPLIIKEYLSSYNSPLTPYADYIFTISQQYGLDYRLLVAIAQQESNLCKKIPDNSHNCWGWGINSRGTLRFSSYEEAILAVAKGIKEKYIDEGLDTPEQIMAKYTPLSNGSWAFGVRQFMDEMGNGDWR